VKQLSVVIPAFNESGRLPSTLRSIAGYLDHHHAWSPAEIVVVDDGSTDGTAGAASSIDMPDGVELVVLELAANRGKGAAIRAGFAGARGRWLLLCDADLATPIEEIEVLQPHVGPDRVVLGSRALDRRLIEIHQPRYRDLMGRIFNLAVRSLLLPELKDTQCGFKLFPGELGRALATVQTIDGFAFDVEILFLAKRWRYGLVEVPVRWRHVEASQVRAIRHSAQMMRDLLALSVRRVAGRLPRAPEEVVAPVSDLGG